MREDRMRILSTLKRLAARPPSPWPVLSVYVNTRPVGAQMTTYRPFLKKRLAEELKTLKSRSPEHESLAVDFARAQHYLDYDVREVTQAVAIFASYAGEDLFDAIQLPVEFSEQQVVVGAMPVLFPLLRMADRYRRAAVAVADGATTRLFVLALGAIEIRREVRPPAARDIAAPGTGTTLAEHSAHALEELAHDEGASWIVVGGEPAAAAELRRALSPAATRLLLEAGTWDPRLPETELAEDVTRRIDERERELRIERARALVGSVQDGSAVLGVDPTLEALRQDRVRELFLGESFPAIVPAWTCRACRASGSGTPPALCPVCGRETVEFIVLREELGRQAQARGAPVSFVRAGSVPAFDDGGGVGAFLR
jgi:hypothetical protein